MSVDLNDLELSPEFLSATDDVTDAGADSQFFAAPAPPDDGKHLVKLGLGRDGIKVKRQFQKGDPQGQPSGAMYLGVHLAEKGQVLEGQPGFTLFDRVTSLKMAQSGTSRLRAILSSAGCPAPVGSTLAELRAHTEAALASEPLVSVWTQWRGSVKLSDGKYWDCIKGQSNFPLDSNGRRMSTVWIKVDESGDQPTFSYTTSDDPEGIEVKAQATPVRYGAAS